MLDGSEIVAVLITGSSNQKTHQDQLYILRPDVHPMDAAKAGTNGPKVSVCGFCPHLGDGTCYVNPAHGSASVYRALCKDQYPFMEPRDAGRGRDIRLGADGDPAALPLPIVKELLSEAKDWTGFTHQWRTCDPEWRLYVRASVEDEEGFIDARRMGYLTYRTRAPWEDKISGEAVCPGSAEAGKVSHCEDCHKCKGTLGRSKQLITILVHGNHARKFIQIKDERRVQCCSSQA